MAAFLSEERNKLGTTTGSIIAFSRELDVNDPQVGLSATLLPAGYLRCDGAVYNETQYPAVAEIIGTGAGCVFKQTDTVLLDTQFQVPDLRSKHIRASSGSDQGVINDMTVTNAGGQVIDKSGVGIEVTSNVGTTAVIDLTGQFRIPPQTTTLRGQISFTRPRNTDEEVVTINAFQPHAHYTTTRRCRIKRRAGNDVFELNYYRNASTIGVHEWYYHTMTDPNCTNNATTNSPDQSLCQPSCKFYAESMSYPNAGWTGSGFGVTFQYHGICKNGCTSFDQYCLVPDNIGTTQSGDDYNALSPSISPLYVETMPNLCRQTVLWNTFTNPRCTQSPYTNYPIAPNYVSTSTEIPNDDIPQTGDNGYSHTASTANVLPLDRVVDNTAQTAYPQVSNIVETTTALDYENDPTEHAHTITYTTGQTNYFINTPEFFITTDGMSSTIQINPDNTRKMDNLIAPFIMVDYLIKI